MDFGPDTPIEEPADVLIEREFRLDQGSLGNTTAKIGYYAIRKDAKFTLGNLGTPGGDSFLAMYLTPIIKEDDGAGSPFRAAIDWAVKQGITNGTGGASSDLAGIMSGILGG